MPDIVKWCIFLNKQIEILNILYPRVIKTEDICEVYENVMPKIQRLIDGVEIGYTPAETVVQPVDIPLEVVNSVAVEHMVADLPDADETVDDAEDDGSIVKWTKRKVEEVNSSAVDEQIPEEEPPVAPTDTLKRAREQAMITADEQRGEPIDGIISFIETEKHPIGEGWTKNTFGSCTYHKNGQNLLIKGESSRIDTTWDYVCDYFAALPDETVIRTIPGLNTKKRVTLARFYDAHPNFSCHIEKVGGSNNLIKDEVLKKDEVRVNADTNSTYEGGAQDVDYNAGLN